MIMYMYDGLTSELFYSVCVIKDKLKILKENRDS